MVFCEEPDLKELVLDLVQYDRQEPDQEKKTRVNFFLIPFGERVWNMEVDGDRHGRYVGEIWVAKKFVDKGLAEKIRRTLNGVKK